MAADRQDSVSANKPPRAERADSGERTSTTAAGAERKAAKADGSKADGPKADGPKDKKRNDE